MGGSAPALPPAAPRAMTLSRPNLLKLALPALVFLTLLVVLTLVNRSPSVQTAGDAPASEAAPGGDTDTQIATLQRALWAASGKADGYALLGDAYLQKARESGDPSYYSRAERSYGEARSR